MDEKSKREFDLVVFGATGVTGEYVVEELAKAYKEEGIKWAVAGRNEEKVSDVLRKVAAYIGLENGLDISVITADVSNDDSLVAMAKRTKILLNCVGPYRFFGEAVTKACLASSTHCIDVSGEPQYLERMQLQYHEEAKNKGVYLLGACGLDSIPADMGLLFLKKHFGGDLNSVETYLSLKAGPEGKKINTGTWNSAIYSVAHHSELQSLRQKLNEKLYPNRLPKFDYPLKLRGILFKSDVAQGWCLPFLGTDRSVMIRTQMYHYNHLNERPIQVRTYIKMASLMTSLVVMFMAGIFAMFARFRFGRYFLEKYPHVFSLGTFAAGGPTREQVKGSSFILSLEGTGWNERLPEPTDKHSERPEKKMIAVVKGPDPAYVTTAICMIHCGLILLKEKENMPGNGGALTPGVAFANTMLIESLQKHGIHFSILDQ